MNIPYKFNPMGISNTSLDIVNPLCITAINKLYVTITTNGSPDDPNVLYSLDSGSSWSSYTLGTDINLSSGDSVLLYGQSGSWSADSYNYLTIKITNQAAVSGDLSSLINYQQLNDAYTFYRLFQNSSVIDASQLVLPWVALTSGCFQGMFNYCSKLVNAPQLPATTLARTCYNQMFSGCTSLVNVPQLPATTLAEHCYSQMFNRCTSLVNAPQLPATTLSFRCYYNMFYGCTSLVNAPELPATTLAEGCYNQMFYDCSSLNFVKVGFKDWSNGTNTANWLFGVAANGAFSAPSQLQAIFDASHIPVNWVLPTITNNDLTANDSNTQYTVSQRSVKSGNQPFYAMDGDDWTYAQTQYSSTQYDWWMIDFHQPTIIYLIDIDLQNQSNKRMHFEGSNDGVNWDQIKTYMNGQGHYTVNVGCDTAYRYYRFICEVKYYYLKIHEVYFTYQKVKGVPDVNSVNSFKITAAENLESYTDEYSFFIGWGKPITSYTYEKRGDNYFVQTDYQPITLAKQNNEWVISDSTFMGVQLRTAAENPFDPSAIWSTAMGLTNIKLTFEILS